MKYTKRIRNLNQLTCPECNGVINEAVTLNCSHTMCRRCCCLMQNRRYSSLTTIDAARRDEVIIRCVTCGQEHQSVDSDHQSMSNSTIVMAIVDKWWKDELEAVQLRLAANEAFSHNNVDLAKYFYDKSIQSGKWADSN